MYIIGISAFYHDSSVALFRDNQLIFACEEEKFTGIKHDDSFPVKALEYIYKHYIGITVKNVGGVHKTLKRRIQKHVQRALAEDKGWALSHSIREHGSEAFTYGLLETVRGRLAAHSRERELINMYNPSLNTF